jgi:protein-tyrosine kinase
VSADPEDQSLRDLDDELADALASLCRLSADAISRVNEAKRALDVTFADAAVHLGLVTPPDIAAALARVRRRAYREGSSLIEAVLRRQSRDRKPTVWHTDHVKPTRELVIAHTVDHARSEKVRALRTKLLLGRQGTRQANVVTLLSPCAAEGRSRLCAELAIAFAQLGRATLLVDADLRHPRQHTLFGSDNQWGLAQALVHGEPPRLHGVEGVPDLALLTSGEVPGNPLELLSGDHFEQMVKGWHQDYEFVVVDTPPVTSYFDGLAVATRVKRVLVVSRAQVTSFKDLKEMSRHLAATPAKVLGAVINNF